MPESYTLDGEIGSLSHAMLIGLAATVVCLILVTITFAALRFAAVKAVEAAELRTTLLAEAASTWIEEGRHTNAMLAALAADPAARNGVFERVLRRRGFSSARAALIRASTSQRLVFDARTAGGVHHATWHPDGEHFASAHGDGAARLWRVGEPEPLATFQHWRSVNCVTFSPDGDHVLTGGDDKAARLWSLSGQVLTTFEGHLKSVRSARFSPDGARVLTIGVDQRVMVWDVDGAAVASFRGNRSCGPIASFGGDGEHLLLATGDETPRLINLSLGTEVLLEHAAPVACAVFTPDRTGVLTVEVSGHARLWSTAGGLLASLEQDEAAGGRAYTDERLGVFSPDGEQVLIRARKKAALWNVKGKRLQVFDNDHSRLDFRLAAFSPDGGRLAVALSRTGVRVWDLQGHGAGFFGVHGHRADTPTGLVSLSFSPDGEMLLSASSDGSVKVWDLSKHERTRYGPLDSPSDRAVFSPTSDRVLTAGAPPALWDCDGRELVRFGASKGAVQTAAFHRDGELVLTTSSSTKASLWTTSGELVCEIGFDDGRAVTSASFSPDGTHVLTNNALWDLSGRHRATFDGFQAAFTPDSARVLSVGRDNAITIWDLTGAAITTFQTHHDKAVQCLSCSADGRLIASIASEEPVRMWDLTGRLHAVLEGEINTNSLRRGFSAAEFSPDGSRVLTADNVGTATLWDLSGKVLATYEAHSRRVRAVCFNPAGTLVATASDDRTARLWAVDGRELALFAGHDGGLHSIEFSSNGTDVLTSSDDKTARLWRVPELVLANDAHAEVRAVIDQLRGSNTTLTLSRQDVARFPALRSSPFYDAPTRTVSPCGPASPAHAWTPQGPSTPPVEKTVH